MEEDRIQHILDAVKEQRLSPYQLKKQSDLSYSAIYGILLGKTAKPREGTLASFEKVLGIDGETQSAGFDSSSLSLSQFDMQILSLLHLGKPTTRQEFQLLEMVSHFFREQIGS